MKRHPDHTRASGGLPENHKLHAPGLKRRPRDGAEACYWLPRPKDIQRGYRPKSILLPGGLTEPEIAARCQALTQALAAWRDAQGVVSTPRYTIGWLVDRYMSDKDSPYQRLGHRAQRTYASFCKTIQHDIGNRRMDPEGGRPRILGELVRKWHRGWSGPAPGKTKPRPGLARHLIVQLRILVTYAMEIGVPGARDVRELLSIMRFPQPEARSVAPTRAQVTALVKAALEADTPRPSIAAVSLAQFELIERRTHIIGSYVAGQWRPGWNWADVSDAWVIRYFQTKTKKNERLFDLKAVPALVAILQQIPKDQRIGAVFKDEQSKEPWRERHYADVFREIAQAAGWPDEIKSMDLRAGGTTEADGVDGVTDRHLQDAGGWTDPKTKDRYRRQKQRNAQNVVELRQKAREQ